MSGFSTDWLNLREPADHAARDPDLLRRAADYVNAASAPVVVDLGCGTGSTVRALGPLLHGARWRLVDHDDTLLAEARVRCGAGVETVAADLVKLDGLPLGGARLVTASALFDLVSQDWLERLAAVLARQGTALYAALSYDGRMAFTPGHALDDAVLAAFNRHQRTGKGFGPALGPDAGIRLGDVMHSHGYEVRVAASDWKLGEASAALAKHLLDGVATATVEAGLEPVQARHWRAARMKPTGVTVGHVDVLALPG